MKKLSEILWSISNDKWIKHKFKHKSGVARIAGQEIAIYSKNVMGCLKFLMVHPNFWHNQTYEPSYIYNENEQQVYNEIYTGEWW